MAGGATWVWAPAAIPNTQWNLRTYFRSVADRFRGYVGDLWDALPPEEQAPFDGILLNAPPWESDPDPTDPESFHASAGKGFSTIERFLAGLPDRLAPDGTAFIRIRRADEDRRLGPHRLAELVAKLQLPLTVQPALPDGQAERGSFVILALTPAAAQE